MTNSKQRGISMVGFLLIAFVAIIVAIFAMKIVPMYMEYDGVKKSMDALAQEQFEDSAAVRESLFKRFNISYVDTVKKEDVTIKSQNGAYVVTVDYYVDKPLVGNLSISGHFQHQVTTK